MKKLLLPSLFFFLIMQTNAQWGGATGTSTSDPVLIDIVVPNTNTIPHLNLRRKIDYSIIVNPAPPYYNQKFLNIEKYELPSMFNNFTGAIFPVFNINDKGYLGLNVDEPQYRLHISYNTNENNQKIINFQRGSSNRSFYYIGKLNNLSNSLLSKSNDHGIFWTDGSDHQTEQVPIIVNGEPTGQFNIIDHYFNLSSNLVIAPYSNARKGMVIKGDGSVGIGTENTFGFLLAVNGSMACKDELTITNNQIAWPDYVFTNYKKGTPLMDLNSLKKFVFTYNHLPNIPSEKEVAENGIKSAEMLSKLLQKVEELTLYILEQQQQIDDLKKMVKEAK